MQGEAVQILEQTGILDKLLGPSGGFVLSLCALGFLGWYHVKSIQRHGEKVEEKDQEIRRLADARVEEEKARSESARELMDRVERYQDKTDGRWAKLGQVLGRMELMMRAIGKKAGAPPPQTHTQTKTDTSLGEDGGVSMF